MTEKTMLPIDVGRSGGLADVVGALVMADENRCAREIVKALSMGQRHGACAETDQQQGRNARTQYPRPRAEH
jgi:hypothetical protein